MNLDEFKRKKCGYLYDHESRIEDMAEYVIGHLDGDSDLHTASRELVMAMEKFKQALFDSGIDLGVHK